MKRSSSARNSGRTSATTAPILNDVGKKRDALTAGRKQKRKRRRKARTEISSSEESSGLSSDSGSEQEESNKSKIIAEKQKKDKSKAGKRKAEESNDDSEEEEEVEKGGQKEGEASEVEEDDKMEIDEQDSKPERVGLEEHIPTQIRDKNDPEAAAQFEEYYMKLITGEFGEELNAIRQAKDFNDRSIPMLVRALKQGVNIFDESEKRLVLEAGKVRS